MFFKSPIEYFGNIFFGRMSRASVRAAARRVGPLPPEGLFRRGVSRKTATKPYTTVGMAVMKVTTARAARRGKPFRPPRMKRQRPTPAG